MDYGLGFIIGLIWSGIGAGLSTSSYENEYKEYMEDLDNQKKDMTAQKEERLKLMDLEFTTKQNEAFREANRSDLISTQNEGLVSQDFNSQFDLLNLNMEAEGFEFNQMASAAAQSKGNALSNAAASGTRTSTLNDAIDMEAATNAMQLQLQEDQTRASDNYNLNSLVQRLTQNRNGIQNDRWRANDLREDWSEGGGNYNIYQQNVKNIESDYQRAFNAIDRDKQRAEDNYTKGWWTAFFNGANQAFNYGTSYAQYIKDTGVLDSVKSLFNTEMNYGPTNHMQRKNARDYKRNFGNN